MKRLIIILSTLIALTACKNTEAPGYVVQVSLGGWHAPDYTSAQIIDRIDSVAQMIPVRKVIIGWSLDTSIYREVGAFLHGKGIEMLLWLPVFAETEEMCDNTPAVDLWGRIPANYDLTAGEGFRFNRPSSPENAANVVGIYDRFFAGCGFDGAVISWNIMEAPDAHIAVLGRSK